MPKLALISITHIDAIKAQPVYCARFVASVLNLKGNAHMQYTRLFALSTQPVTLPDTGYIRLPLVLAYAGLSKSTWYDGMKAGIYPKQSKIGRRAVGWDVEDIRRWKAANKKAL